MDILVSGKTGANKYDLLENDPLKVLTRLDARQLAESSQFFAEVTRGWSFAGDEGSSDALVTDLSIIDAASVSTYKEQFTKSLQTLISHQNTLAVDGTTTANAIVLVPKKISSDVAPNAVDYTVNAPLPLKWQEDLTFTFRATLTNTGATTLSMPGLSGLSGTIDVVAEDEAPLTGGEIVSGKYITIKLKTISSVKKAVLIYQKTKSIRVFTSSGTWTKPAGCRLVHVKIVGGGGSGGNGTAGGTGAGGGGYSEKFITSGLGATETVTVGAGGTAVTNGNNGNTGGTTSFGSHFSATGGTGGKTSNGAGAGSGGNGSGGNINIQGSGGGLSISSGLGGDGGGSQFSGRCPGAIGSNAGPGLAYGGGSGGANGGTGGAGAAGIVIVYEYY
jgi:hypothetical protein